MISGVMKVILHLMWSPGGGPAGLTIILFSMIGSSYCSFHKVHNESLVTLDDKGGRLTSPSFSLVKFLYKTKRHIKRTLIFFGFKCLVQEAEF